MCQIISLINNRSASGKTFVSTYLGMTLASMGEKVLLVDLDPQANLTSNFSVKERLYTSYHAMVEGGEFVVNQLGDNLDIIPSVIDLVGCEIELINNKDRELVLNKFLKQFKSKYDFIIIDCPPGLGLLVVNALVASDMVLVPVNPHEKDFNINTRLNDTIRKVNVLLRGKPLDVHFLLNMCETEESISTLKSYIKKIHGIPFLSTTLCTNEIVDEYLNQMKIEKINPYINFKPSSEFEHLSMEMIILKKQNYEN